MGINKKMLMITGLLVLLVAFAGCKSGTVKKETAKDANLMPKEAIEKVLKLQEVPYTSVSVAGKEVTVVYEASEADNFDTQIVSDWGMIFGTLAESNYDTIRIVNTVNGVKYTTLSTTPKNVHDLLTSRINETVFWENVELD